MLSDVKFSDLTVISAEGKKLYLHKSILASRSPVFAAVFEHDMIENQKNVINIEDIEYAVLSEVFRFIYSGKVHEISSRLFDILRAADKYAIEGLKILCEETMLYEIKLENAINYLIEADKYNCSNVNKIIDFIVSAASDIVQRPEFEALCTSHPKFTYEITKAAVLKKKSGQ